MQYKFTETSYENALIELFVERLDSILCFIPKYRTFPQLLLSKTGETE